MSAPLWIPSAERVSTSNMTQFMRYVEELTGRRISSYKDLYEWSVKNTEEFWKSIWVMAGVIHSKPYNSILDNPVMPGARWFDGAHLNFAENLLRFRDENIAVTSLTENASPKEITFKELYFLTAKCAEGLKKIGVKKGDRVAGFLPNVPEAIIAMLASVSLGAVWTSCSPDFGTKGVIDRFGQTEPRVLFAMEAYSYNGKVFNCIEKIKDISAGLPGLEKVVIVTNNEYEHQSLNDEQFISFSELLDNKSETIEFEQVPFDHPVYIMYSSGTTGKTKCIVHGAGGTLLQHFKELSLHTNLTRNDTITFYTTCGWMMWNWLVSALNIGSHILIYDGSPAFPDINILWKNIEEYKITVFGTSPRFISMCLKSDAHPGRDSDLSSLKTILSTGAPLPEDNFKWIYNSVKKDVQLSSISGGTDIISCFMLGNPNLPVYAGEIQCRGLGMKVEAFDENARPVLNKKGELVCTAPFPSMPVFFWNDEDDKKYKAAYFNHFPGIWRHGDYIKITPHEGIIVYGRSDSTLNPGGVRIGTAEIYNIIESLEEVADSIAAAYKENNDDNIILFVVLKDGLILTEDLIQKLKDEIKRNATPRHVPSKIFQVNDIPRTINGKKVEVAVTNLINEKNIDNKEVLANPQALEEFRKIFLHLNV